MTNLNAKLVLLIMPACLAAFSPGTTASARDGNQQRPIHIGSITGDPEKDTVGYVVSHPEPRSVSPVIWHEAADYVGTRFGNAESDTYGRKVLQQWAAAAASREQD